MNANTPVRVLMVGIGGWGNHNLELVKSFAGEAEVVAAVDPSPQPSAGFDWLNDQRIPCFGNMKAFTEAGIPAELAIISSPIHFHCEQSCAALEAGLHVLSEKPIAATVAEAERMANASRASGKFLEIGFQWSFSEPIRRLKCDIGEGRFGAPERFVTRVAWPRPESYFRRNRWAGKIKDESGRPINDSPVNNATAHFLHNMLNLLEPRPDLPASPTTITAELYRANAIESYDAACCRIETAEGPELLFLTAHCVGDSDGPIFRLELSEAIIEFDPEAGIHARPSKGEPIHYGHPEDKGLTKIKECLRRCRAPQSNSFSGPEIASAHTLCVEALAKLPIRTFSADELERRPVDNHDTLILHPQMNQALRDGYAQHRLFSELNLPWTTEAAGVGVP